jgi:hypothetical protein
MLYVLIIKIDKLMKNFGYNLEHINLIRLNLHWKTLCIPNQITKKIKRSPKWHIHQTRHRVPSPSSTLFTGAGSSNISSQTPLAILDSRLSRSSSHGPCAPAAAAGSGAARTSISGGVELLPPERGRASPWPRSMNGAATEKGMEWIE